MQHSVVEESAACANPANNDSGSASARGPTPCQRYGLVAGRRSPWMPLDEVFTFRGWACAAWTSAARGPVCAFGPDDAVALPLCGGLTT
jgi:hypothetical protein